MTYRKWRRPRPHCSADAELAGQQRHGNRDRSFQTRRHNRSCILVRDRHLALNRSASIILVALHGYGALEGTRTPVFAVPGVELCVAYRASSVDFRDIVRGALLTGCRYGELIGLRVADYNSDTGTVTVRESKAGKVRHVVLTDEGRGVFEVLAAGRAHNVPLFLRADGKPWGSSHQQRPLPRHAPMLAFPRRSASIFSATLTDRRLPCAAYRWASLPRNSGTPTRE
jgi:hypothetical protein